MLEWKHEVCDTNCYTDVFFTADDKIDDVDVFARILPQKDGKKNAEVLLLQNGESLPLAKTVDTFLQGMNWAEEAIQKYLPELKGQTNHVFAFIQILDPETPTPKVLMLIDKNKEIARIPAIQIDTPNQETKEEALLRLVSSITKKTENIEEWQYFLHLQENTTQENNIHCYRTKPIRMEELEIRIDESLDTIDAFEYQDIVLKHAKSEEYMPLLVQAMINQPTDKPMFLRV